MGLGLPGLKDYFLNTSLWWCVIAFLVLDDMKQYWWHRFSHVNRSMWKLHRPHHVIEEMGVLVAYRIAVLYYALMPGIWFSGLLIYLGMGYVYLIYLPIKLVVILLAHSETKWDRFLYRYKFLSPLAWIIGRTISTPSTRYAHHGLTAEDGISHPNGNYGNLLLIGMSFLAPQKLPVSILHNLELGTRLMNPGMCSCFSLLFDQKTKEVNCTQLRLKTIMILRWTLRSTANNILSLKK